MGEGGPGLLRDAAAVPSIYLWVRWMDGSVHLCSKAPNKVPPTLEPSLTPFASTLSALDSRTKGSKWTTMMMMIVMVKEKKEKEERRG
jgi:hypothetical protein